MSDNFDAKAVEETRGRPLQSSARHTGSKIRAHIEDNEKSGVGEDIETPDAPQAEAEEYPEQEEEDTRDNWKAEETIEGRAGQSYNFYIHARGVLKYGPTSGCPR